MADEGDIVCEAVLLLDYAKSSGFTAKFGNVQAAKRKAAMERLVLTAAEQFNVQRPPKDTGDGFFATFADEADAVNCAIAILQHLPTLNQNVLRDELTIHLRIGITFGELVVDAKGERKGEAANLSARFESMKPEELRPDEGGMTPQELAQIPHDRILVSGEVYDGIKESHQVRYAGWMKPKDIPRLYQVYVVDWHRASRIELPGFSSDRVEPGPRGHRSRPDYQGTPAAVPSPPTPEGESRGTKTAEPGQPSRPDSRDARGAPSGVRLNAVSRLLMDAFTWIADVLSGGKQRRLRRNVARLGAAFARSEKGPAFRGQVAGLYGKSVQVALRVRPSEAVRLLQEYDARIPRESYGLAFSATDVDWLFTQAGRGDPAVLTVCMEVAARLNLRDQLRQAAEGLAYYYADAGDSHAVIPHLNQCRRHRLLNRDLLAATMSAFLSKKQLEEDTGWVRFLGELPESDLPPIFEVHLALGRARDAASLASTTSQRQAALACCLRSTTYEDIFPGIALAETLKDSQSLRTLHEAAGDALFAKGNFGAALEHYRSADSPAKVSLCHERLGNYFDALRTCPLTLQERVLNLVSPCEELILSHATHREYAQAVMGVMALIGVLKAVPNRTATCEAKLHSVTRYRDALLTTARAHFSGLVESQAGEERRRAYMSWSNVEELAGEAAAAAQLADDAGDYLRASRLWESDEQYGEAVRVLGSYTDRPEIQARMAQLKEAAGDALGAATLYEKLNRHGDARRGYEAAGNYTAAARCLVKEFGEEAATESEEYADLMLKAGLANELATRCLLAVRSQGGERNASKRLEQLLRADSAARLSESLRAEIRAELASLRRADRRTFDERVKSLFSQARDEVLRRYSQVWGMDLGTTKCAVAIYDKEEGGPVVCSWRGDYQFCSSLAFHENGQELVGLTKEELLAPGVRAGVLLSKRRMGSDTQYRVGDKLYRPEEVAARFIAHGRTIVESFLIQRVKDRVKTLAQRVWSNVPEEWIEEAGTSEVLSISMPKAVVTIPAYFGFNQKKATRDACTIAGIEVARLIHEPTAGCMAAAASRHFSGTAVVVDLGAGTLDLSVLDVDAATGVYEVYTIDGDTEYGGSDFDAVIAQHLVSKLESERGIRIPPRGSLMRRIDVAAEHLKIELSSREAARYVMRAFGEFGEVVLELNRSDLEKLLAERLRLLQSVCRRCLERLKLSQRKIDRLLLVGGPMLSPVVRRYAEEVFSKKAMAIGDPRTAVACGAALQGAILAGSISDVVLLDVVPFSLGIKVREGERANRFARHIKKDSKIPTSYKDIYTTCEDDQTVMGIQVFQGESDVADENVKLAEFRLEGIPRAKAGEPKIEVSFDIDANGVLTVHAKDLGTNRERAVSIADTALLSPTERENMRHRFDVIRELKREREELSAQMKRLRELRGKVSELDLGDSAAEWRRRLAVYQGSIGDYSPGPEEQGALYEMFNRAAETEVALAVTTDRARNVPPQVDNLIKGTEGLSISDAHYAESLAGLTNSGRQLEALLRDLIKDLSELRRRFDSWNDVLAGLVVKITDPVKRFAACYDAKAYAKAIEAFDQVGRVVVRESLWERYLECLANTLDRNSYRRCLSEHARELRVSPVNFDKLNEFCKMALPSLAWIRVDRLGMGSGFLVSEDLVATARHLVCPDPRSTVAVGAGQIRANIDGGWKDVREVILPSSVEIDLALLRLSQAPGSAAFRLGYSQLVEVGERVLALGFPLAEVNLSVRENVLVDCGIVNRFRTNALSGVRVFEIGIRANPGLSGGPMLNDLGEVVGVVSFAELRSVPARTEESGTFVFSSSHAVGVEPLREMLRGT